MTRNAFRLLAICSPLFCGCGTFADAMAGPVDDHLYYRGVRLDIAALKGGTHIMAIDLPFSACADTLLVPSIAYQQLTQPGTKHKSALHAVGEELGKAVTNDVIVPITTEMIKADAELRKQQSTASPHPAASPKIDNAGAPRYHESR